MNQLPMISRLHHIGLVSREMDRTSDFYQRVLGLGSLGFGPAPLLLGRDSRQLDAVRAHYLGDGIGGKGSVLAIIDQPDAAPGAPGIGGTHHFAMAVADRDLLLQWKRRLLDEGYPVNGILDRHYFQSIYTRDPDGTIVELATLGPGWTIDEPPDCLGESHRPPPPEMLNTNRDRAQVAAENWPEPVPGISPAMRISGLHHVTAIAPHIEQVHAFVADQLGLRRVKRTSNFDDAASFHWYWGVADGAPGTLVTYFERKPEREQPVRMGAGQVAHYGMAAQDLDAVTDRLSALHLSPTGIATFGPDSHRYEALATRDPAGQPVIIASAMRT
jgi:glyoxalase family protein